ncbi:MAG TPA: zinc ribbon domain-containing protein [Bryobacteraceae bacterium]|jgi:putative FmdB family regulatory protein
MPIFEYKCEDCGSKFEKLVRRPGAEDVLCPSCGQSHLEQQYSSFAAHANGSPKEMAMPSCASGMCQTPGLCGRNN